MTHTVKGHYENGIVTLDEPVAGLEGRDVSVTLTTPESEEKEMTPEGWAHLRKILDEAKMETGIPDLAHEHDHYLHGTPKKGYASPEQLRREEELSPEALEDERIRAGWDLFMKLIEENQMDTGITDLAHQHDHYLHGTPKREPYPPEPNP